MDRREKDDRHRGGGKALSKRWKDRAPGPYRHPARPRPQPALDTSRRVRRPPASAPSVVPTPTLPLVSPPTLTSSVPRFGRSSSSSGGGRHSRGVRVKTGGRAASLSLTSPRAAGAGWGPACAVRGSCSAGRPGSRNSVDTYCVDCGAPRGQPGASGQGMRLEGEKVDHCRPGTPRPFGGVIVESKVVPIRTFTAAAPAAFATFRHKIVKTLLWGSDPAWRFQRPVCVSCYLAAASDNLDQVSHLCTCPSEF